LSKQFHPIAELLSARQVLFHYQWFHREINLTGNNDFRSSHSKINFQPASMTRQGKAFSPTKLTPSVN